MLYPIFHTTHIHEKMFARNLIVARPAARSILYNVQVCVVCCMRCYYNGILLLTLVQFRSSEK